MKKQHSHPVRHLVLATSLALSAGFVHAADAPPVTSNVVLASNYVWRGVSQSAEQLALQGGFDYAHSSGVYVGTWGSNVNFGNDAVDPIKGDGAQLELDIYGGYKFSGAGLDWDVGLLHYNYPGSASALKYNFTEVYVGGAYGPVAVKYSYTNDYTTDIAATSDEKASYLEINFSQELTKGLALGLHAGRSSGDFFKAYGINDYTDYKLSLTKDLGNGFSVSAAYTDTDAKDPYLVKKGVFANDGMFILTVSRSM